MTNCLEIKMYKLDTHNSMTESQSILLSERSQNTKDYEYDDIYMKFYKRKTIVTESRSVFPRRERKGISNCKEARGGLG